MKQFRLGVIGLSVVACVLSVIPTAFAQDVELPLTWQGEGKAIMMTEDGVHDFDIQSTIKVDSDGWVTGKFTANEGEAIIKRFYYESAKGGARRLVLVLLEQKENPSLFIIQGRILNDTLFYGEALMKSYEKEGEIEQGLGLGDNAAQEIFGDYIPKSLEKALKTCKPVGGFAVKGSYVK